MVIINSNSKQKTSLQSYKAQINILPFPGLAQTGTEQLGQGATLLGWPKSIHKILYEEFLSHKTLKIDIHLPIVSAKNI